MNSVAAAGVVQHAVRTRHRHVDIVALALQRHAAGTVQDGLDLVRLAARRVAILQGDVVVAVDDDVDIGTVGVEALAHHQPGLAMRIAAVGDPIQRGGEGKVAGRRFGDEEEVVGFRPDVATAAGDAVSTF